MTPHESHKSVSVAKLGNWILICLVLGVCAFTAAMFAIAHELSGHFGPQVQNDLRWRVVRGAQELSHAAEHGLLLGDRSLVRASFAAYERSDDVQAIVALAANGQLIAKHGTPPESAQQLVRGAQGALRIEGDYLVSWAEAESEGVPVGKIALVVSRHRLKDALSLRSRAKLTVLFGGLLALALGGLVVTFFTRAVSQRDAQLSDYAKNLERNVDERTRALDARNRGMRMVLDNVAQGFITIDLEGVMASERSAVLDRWFSPPTPGMRISEYLADPAPNFSAWLALGLEQLREDILPAELTLDQLPKRFEGYGRTFDVSYTRVQNEQNFARLLVIISDVTEALARERAERAERELLTLFQRISVDRAGVDEFLREAAGLIAALRVEDDVIVQKRLLHTLKGNCAIYGLESYAELMHQLEDELCAHEAGLNDEQRSTLVSRWKEAMGRVSKLLGGPRRDVIDVERSELDALRMRAQSGIAASELLPVLRDWSHEPVARRLERLAEQARAVARRLDKPEPWIEIRAAGIRLEGRSFGAYWSAMVHVVCNAVDHGIEGAKERALLGKPEIGTLELHATRENSKLSIIVRDDGAGVRWERIRKKAQALGLPHQTHDDLVQALFADGLSTKDDESDTSGRGVGLSALRATVSELGGSIEVASEPGQGSCFTFTFEERSQLRLSGKLRLSLSSLMPPLR